MPQTAKISEDKAQQDTTKRKRTSKKTIPLAASLPEAPPPRSKSIYPVINYTCLQFNLRLIPSEISLFRQEVLRCITDDADRVVFSNETTDANGKQKNIVHYPMVQFRVRDGFAAIWAMQNAVGLVARFVAKFKNSFLWQGKPFHLQVTDHASLPQGNYPIHLFNPKLVLKPVVYQLFYYLPFTNAGKNKNYDWIKENHNLPDVEKTHKIEQLLTNHLCSFIHYAGGFIPKQKIKLTIIDKKPLDNVSFDGRKHIAYNIRYTVNVYLPDFIGLGNKCSHGFGWQKLEQS